MVSRTGYTGELGYEIFCHPKDALTVFDAVWEAGEPHGLMPLGLQALDMLRIEAGLVFAGYEFCDQTDPFEAGIGFTVPLQIEERGFYRPRGADPAQASTRRGSSSGWRWRAMRRSATATASMLAAPRLASITSATRSPILKKTIALARVDVTHGELGTEVEIGKLDGQQKRLPARIVRFPHYDPEKTRVRA